MHIQSYTQSKTTKLKRKNFKKNFSQRNENKTKKLANLPKKEATKRNNKTKTIEKYQEKNIKYYWCILYSIDTNTV